MRTAPPPSEMMQQSNMCNGSEIIREANTSSTVNGSRYMASGFRAALARASTATRASCADVVPYWCM